MNETTMKVNAAETVNAADESKLMSKDEFSNILAGMKESLALKSFLMSSKNAKPLMEQKIFDNYVITVLLFPQCSTNEWLYVFYASDTDNKMAVSETNPDSFMEQLEYDLWEESAVA